ncbi:DUF6924 domain-containing protein [Streptomyces phytophilus]|uniref:DUF6924 domain-containing protein n=1 Tax=Streptomyces phytophilus TaxID=722715 RepID=UPI0015F0AF07|nr:hypothetical protein [Streptomyces phytophilus]
MPCPELPRTTSGEVLMVCAYYENGEPGWGGLLAPDGGGAALVPDDSPVRLRPVADPGWDHLRGGNVPALLPGGASAAPVAVLVDIVAVYGGEPLLVDLAAIPGRGVRVAKERLGEVLAALFDGALVFDDLIRDTDLRGTYRGGAGRRAFPVPTTPPQRDFPALPATEGALLVRTSFEDDDGWRALLDELGGTDEEGWVGADIDPDDIDVDRYPLTALVVDDPAYEGLPPGSVPALVPPEEYTVLVALADAGTFAAADRPLAAVDLHDTPGNIAVLPWHVAGSMVCNLEIANMDFHDFVPVEGVRPWWEGP